MRTADTTSRRLAPAAGIVLVLSVVAATVLGVAGTAAAATGTGVDVTRTAIAGAPTTFSIFTTRPTSSAFRTVPVASLTATAPPDVFGPGTTSTGFRSVTTATGATATCTGVCFSPTYTAPAGYVGSDTVYYVVQPCAQTQTGPFTFGTRCSGDIGRGTITLDVVPNQPPTANDDTATARLPVGIDVLANDTDPNGTLDRLTIVNSSGTTLGGTYDCNVGSMTCTYWPSGTFDGTDSFTYTMRDRAGATSSAVVHLDVTPNATPLATPATMTVRVGTAGQLPDGQATDFAPFVSDADGDQLQVQIENQPSNGNISCVGTSCSYAPSMPSAPLDDSFTYVVTDGLFTSAPSTATVDVVLFDSVTVTDDAVTVDPLTTTAIDVGANDGSLGQIVPYTGVSTNNQPYSCTVTACTYTSAAPATTDTFLYVRSDGETQGVATVTVTIRNVAPVALDEIGATATDVPLTKNLAAFVSDVNGNLVDVEAVTQPANGTASCSAWQCTYTPASGFSGSDSFTYRAVDSFGLGSTPASITVEVGAAGTAAGVLVPGVVNTVGSGEASDTHPLATNVSAVGGAATGPVTIAEAPAAGPPPSGYQLVGFQSVITAPTATVDQPLRLEFSIAPGFLPALMQASEVTVFRNGVAVAACTSPNVPRAEPTPCLAPASGDGASGMLFLIYTVAASTWQFGVTSPVDASAGGPYVVDEGSQVQLDATGSTGNGPLAFAWTPTTMAGASTATPTFTGVDDGTVDVSVQVTAGGVEDTATTTVTVRNVAPTVAAPTVASAVLGTTTTISGTIVDPGTADNVTVDVDWGDGTTTAATVTGRTYTASHAYANVGTHAIGITATDDDGGAGRRTVDVTVRYRTFSLLGGLVAAPGTNRWIAGLPVVVPFDLGGDVGRNVLTPGSPTRTPANCATWAPTGAPTAMRGLLGGVTIGGRFVYTYVGETARSLRGTCQQLTFSFADGSTVVVRYRFS